MSGDTVVSVRVAVRIRREIEDFKIDVWEINRDKNAAEMINSREKSKFTFDNVFGPEVSNKIIYNDIGMPTMKRFMDGYHVCLFCYGQTGSGKTFTMFGPDDAVKSLADGHSAGET